MTDLDHFFDSWRDVAMASTLCPEKNETTEHFSVTLAILDQIK